MNIFVLCTGRCGSLSFIKACEHMTNFSSGHESLVNQLGVKRFAYPENHIEADNRLSWFLGRLDKTYGDKAFYIHLTRDKAATARSFAKRYGKGIIAAYEQVILSPYWPNDAIQTSPYQVSMDYVQTVQANIRMFLENKTLTMQFELENWEEHFIEFWDCISAEGDLDAALREFNKLHNKTEELDRIME